jgi:NAD(P)-dependent dehydrogenase (short-subunit alcohol dehydrogenase family)
MPSIDASALLRPGLLDGVAVVLACVADGGVVVERPSPADVISVACTGLGARVLECPVSFDGQGEIEEEAIEREARVAAERASACVANVVMLAVDGASVFARACAHDGADAATGDAGGEGARRGLRACLVASWIVTRALAAGVLLADGRGGRIVYLAPSAAAGEHADAARAGLENLARTLSIEWARHAITTVAIAPSGVTSGAAGEVAAALIAYLASPAGAYFSGCLLDLRGPAGASI